MSAHDPTTTADPSAVSIPALLRAARATYGQAIRAALAQAGCEDIPGNGLFVIGAVARAPLPMARLIDDLGGSKQAVGQLVDTLARRGYVDRVLDANDRRRVCIAATARGRQAAAIIGQAVRSVDAELARRVPAAHIAHARTVLLALAQLRAGMHPTHAEETT